MALARNFIAATDNPNQIALNWEMPLDFNNSNSELIVTKNASYFPMELFNPAFPTKATDTIPIEIFRGNTIVGSNLGTISVAANVLTDSAANFPIGPSLKGRLLRDYSSQVHKILSNTATTITVDSTETIANGKYVILPDFPTDTRDQENYEVDIRTAAGAGFISNLVYILNSQLLVKSYEQDELANMIFKDGDGNKFIIKSNNSSTIFLFENTVVPVIGIGMAILGSFTNSSPVPYLDTFKTQAEADVRVGTNLLDDKWYYYTVFTNIVNANVAQADFAVIDSGTPTQSYALSTKDSGFGDYLFNLWPEVFKSMDDTGDLHDLMQVFGFQFNQLHSMITTYRLQDTDNLVVNAILPLSEQMGLPSVGFSIGIDTLRRIGRDMLPNWKLKGSKEGIALFIREITTWDITDGTGDYSAAISDTIPNVAALRFFDTNLGSTNTRLTETDPLYVPGGRFAKGLPGVIIPGFFTFREFVITVPSVALYIGASQTFAVSSNVTTMGDSTANFGAPNSLVGNYLLPNQEEVNDIFQIVSNTSNTVTVKGIITNKNPGGKYAILSPLNTNRFVILNKLMPFYAPFGTKASYDFN